MDNIINLFIKSEVHFHLSIGLSHYYSTSVKGTAEKLYLSQCRGLVS